jgi:hypothetical protein
MTSESSDPRPAVDIQKTLLELLVRELRRVYDHVDGHPAAPGGSAQMGPDGWPRILVRWYDNAPLARIVFAPNELNVELGPRRSERWQRVVRVRYQDPKVVERILRLIGTAEPGVF